MPIYDEIDKITAIEREQSRLDNLRHDLIEAEMQRQFNPSPAAPTDRMLQFFAHDHLPPRLQAVSVEFARLANCIVGRCPHNPERDEALRKLLEAKDCAVRALLYKEE
jgi:hypothetical protein